MKRAFQSWDCVYVCQADNFWMRLESVLSFQDPNEYRITIADEWPLATGSGPLIESGEASVRSALRQDPDCLIVTKAEGCGPLLLQAALTGHRVVAGCSGDPRRALQELLGEQPELGFTQARTVFFDPAGLWLYQAENDEFEQVSAYENGAFCDLSQLPEATPLLPSPQPEPLEAPEEWGEPTPLLPELEAIFTPLARPCYAPVFGEGQPLGQFGGSPRLAPGEEWPRCGACLQRLHLVCQLDLRHLPEDSLLGREGWLQLFYCTSDHCNQDKAWGPYSNNALARQLGEGDISSQSPPNPAFQRKEITGWHALTDYPGWEERPPLTDRQRTASHNLQEPAFLEHFCLTGIEEREKAAAYFRNYPGDKFLGWPAWTQAAEYPLCSECLAPMRMLFQVNNDGHNSKAPGYNSCHGQIFAADGNGHIFICANHPHNMTFSWACG